MKSKGGQVLFDLEHASIFYFYRGNIILFVPNTIAKPLYYIIRKTKDVPLAFYSDCTIETLIFTLDIDSNFICTQIFPDFHAF